MYKLFKTIIIIVITIYFCMYSQVFAVIKKNDFKITNSKLYVEPLVPYTIYGLNYYIIKNLKGEPIYILSLSSREYSYSWRKDNIMIKKQNDLTPAEKNRIIAKNPLNLYYTAKIEFKINMKQLSNNVDKNLKQIEIPYFIILNNKSTNNIYYTQLNTFKIKLVKDETLVQTYKVNFKVKFKDTLLPNLELLTGFKLNNQQYQEVQKYLSLSY